MKSKSVKKFLAVLLVCVVLITVIVMAFRIYSHTFANFISDENIQSVYIPDGMADKYIGITEISPNEDHRIWMYNFNKKEKAEIENDLRNQIWQTLSEDECGYISKVYFNEQIEGLNYNDNFSYCLYDCKDGKFVSLAVDDNLLYGEHNILLMYDRTAGKYYCVSKATS